MLWVESVSKFQNMLLVSSWIIVLNFLLISISLSGIWTSEEEAGQVGWIGIAFIYLFYFFFVNSFCTVFLLSSLLNIRLHFHVTHAHLITQHKVSFSCHFISFYFFFKNFFLHFYMWPPVLFADTRIKCGQEYGKNSTKKLPSE